MSWVTTSFGLRALLELLALSLGAGVLGTFVVLRGLAFYSHALGSATFPGLVLADGVGLGASLGAAGAAAAFAAAAGRGWRSPMRGDAHVGLVLTGALALGIVLASDVFASGVNVETLLFGSLLAVGDGDLVVAAAAATLVLLANLLLGRRWVADGFDPASEREGRPFGSDVALLALVAVMSVAMLAALGALLTTALLVIPAASARLWTTRLVSWQAASVGLAAIVGVAGLGASMALNAPPGPAIAVVAVGAFALSAGVRLASGWRAPHRVRLAMLGAGCLGAGALAGCGGDSTQRSPRPQVQVVATTPVVGDLVREVGGDAIGLRVLLSPNSDPHGYEPRPDDVRGTSEARLIVRSGGDLDDWMSTVIERSGTRAGVVTVIDDLAAPLRGEADEHGEGEHEERGEGEHGESGDHEEEPKAGPESEATEIDPHWWHDPRNAEAAANRIRDELIRLAPGSRASFTANAADFVRRARALDARIAGCMSRVPERNRKLVTDHDAFSYFARRYDVEVVGAVIPARTTQAQPSAGDTNRLIEAIRRERVGAIFAEESVNARVAEAIARETGASTEYTLYGDTLGPPGSPGATYLSMMDANANELTRGFTGAAAACTAPR